MNRRRLRLAVAAVAAAVLAGCSATKTIYNHLDWWASWQLGKIVDLDDPQQELFERSFRPLWDWHRSTQLALYAADLRELAGLAQQPLTPEQVADFLRRGTQHSQRLLDEVMPAGIRLLQTLDDEQVADLMERVNEWREDRAEEAAELSAEEQQDEMAHDLRDGLKHWVGRLTPEQMARVRRWAAERRYDDALETAYQKSWAEGYAALLAQRTHPGFAERLQQYFREPSVPLRAANVEKRDGNRRLWIAMMSDLSATLSERQRKHLRHELLELARKFDELASEQRAQRESRPPEG